MKSILCEIRGLYFDLGGFNRKKRATLTWIQDEVSFRDYFLFHDNFFKNIKIDFLVCL